MTVTMEQAQFDWFGVWNSAGPAGQIFLFLLMLVGLYAVYFAAFACLRLRTLRPIRDADAVRKALASLNHRSANLRQLVVAMFFLFGFFYLLQIRSVYATPDTTRQSQSVSWCSKISKAISSMPHRCFWFFSCFTLSPGSHLARFARRHFSWITKPGSISSRRSRLPTPVSAAAGTVSQGNNSCGTGGAGAAC